MGNGPDVTQLGGAVREVFRKLSLSVNDADPRSVEPLCPSLTLRLE